MTSQFNRGVLYDTWDALKDIKKEYNEVLSKEQILTLWQFQDVLMFLIDEHFKSTIGAKDET